MKRSIGNILRNLEMCRDAVGDTAMSLRRLRIRKDLWNTSSGHWNFIAAAVQVSTGHWILDAVFTPSRENVDIPFIRRMKTGWFTCMVTREGKRTVVHARGYIMDLRNGFPAGWEAGKGFCRVVSRQSTMVCRQRPRAWIVANGGRRGSALCWIARLDYISWNVVRQVKTASSTDNEAIFRKWKPEVSMIGRVSRDGESGILRWRRLPNHHNPEVEETSEFSSMQPRRCRAKVACSYVSMMKTEQVRKTNFRFLW